MNAWGLGVGWKAIGPSHPSVSSGWFISWDSLVSLGIIF